MGTSFENIINGIYWVIIALFLLIGLISLRLVTRPTRFSVGSHSASLLFNMLAFVAYSMLIKIGTNLTFALVFAVIGVVLGLGIGALSKVYSENGVILLKRSILSPLLVLLAYCVSVYFAAFGGDNLMSFGVLLVIAVTGLTLGAGTLEAYRASKNA